MSTTFINNETLGKRLLGFILNCLYYKKAGLIALNSIIKIIDQTPFLMTSDYVFELYIKLLQKNDSQLTLPLLKNLRGYLMDSSNHQDTALELCMSDEVLKELKLLMTKSGKITIVQGALEVAIEIQR